MEQKDLNTMFSHKTDIWATPQKFFDDLNEEFHFTLDPCANKENHKCEKYFTEEDDGLSQDWSKDIVFCNPPYSKSKEWIKKASEEAKKGSTVVMLIPARTDTKAWHEYIFGQTNVEIRFIKGRLKFGDGKNSAPFPSAIIIFKPFTIQN